MRQLPQSYAAGAATSEAQIWVWATATRGGTANSARVQAPPAAALYAVAVLQAPCAAFDAHPRHACCLHGARLALVLGLGGAGLGFCDIPRDHDESFHLLS